jgi:RNA polymerase sigma-70 factor (ECF subfamily)
VTHEPDPSPATIAAAARGDARAFEEIVRRFERPVWSLAFRFTGDAELARDVTQEVFLRLWKNLGRYDPSRPFAPWFLKLATNFALNAKEAAKLRKAASLDAPPRGQEESRLPADPAAATAMEGASDREAKDAVRKAVAELDAKYAGPVALFYLEGLDLKAIAERLDLPEGTVKIRLHRARDILRKTLERFARRKD